jgi:hypothetical protein
MFLSFTGNGWFTEKGPYLNERIFYLCPVKKFDFGPVQKNIRFSKNSQR